MFLLLLLISLGKGGEIRAPEECDRENYLDGYCYTLSSRNVVYEEARARCESVSSTLLSEISSKEMQLVLQRLHRTVWLAPDQGDHTPSQCPAFYPISGKTIWQVSCTTLLSFICKRRVLPSTEAPPTTPDHSSSGCMKNLDRLASMTLSAHNSKRAQHKNTFLQCWNWELEETSGRHARKLALAGGVDHDTETQDGENIYSALWTETRPLDWYYNNAVEEWYREIRFYDWDRPGYSSVYGHFTQLVWRPSYLVGCGHGFGLNRLGKKRIVVVCRYSPPGSLAGDKQYRANVQPLIK